MRIWVRLLGVGALSMLVLTGCSTQASKTVNGATQNRTDASTGANSTTVTVGSRNTISTVSSTESTGTTGTGSNITAHAQSQGEIQAYYSTHKEHILHIYHKSDGALVEWNFANATIASRYDWWESGWKAPLTVPTNTDFAKMQSASSSDIRLVTTGPNSINGLIKFPYIIDDYRGTESSSTPFQMTERPYFLLLSHSVKFGFGKPSVMTAFYPNADGFQASFGPKPGDKANFYAGTTGCPTMVTSYDAKSHAFTVRFFNTTLSPQAKQAVAHMSNAFVKAGVAIQSGSDVEIHLTLNQIATHYNAKQDQVYEQNRIPYVSFHFAANMDSMYPAIEEQ